MFEGYPIITNFNFNNIKDFEGPDLTYTGFRKYGFKRENDYIKFYTNFIACPCIYYIQKNDKFAFSFDYRLVVNFCKENNIELTDNYENLNQINDNLKEHIKCSIKDTYKYNLNYIEGWKEVKLFDNGQLEIEKYKLDLFTFDIKDNYYKLKYLLLKYKKAIKNLVDKKLFIPTITAGLDTRGLSGLWKDYVNDLPGYFLKAIKNDNKNHVEQGQAEIKIADQVAKVLNLPANRFEVIDDEICTLTGILNENSIAYQNPNDPDYVYKFIQHSWGKNYYPNKLVPFIDDDYLIFKQEGELFRTLLVCLLAKDLIHLPFLSGSTMFLIYPNGRQMWPEADFWLNKVAEIFEFWGQDKVDNILKEN